MNQPNFLSAHRAAGPPSRRFQVTSLTKAECRKGPFAAGPNLLVSLLDVSQREARLVLREKLAPGQEVEILFRAVWMARPLKCLAQVVACAPQEKGRWCVEVRFDRAVPYGDLQRMAKIAR
jgi:hypothetical protein